MGGQYAGLWLLTNYHKRINQVGKKTSEYDYINISSTSLLRSVTASMFIHISSCHTLPHATDTNPIANYPTRINQVKKKPSVYDYINLSSTYLLVSSVHIHSREIEIVRKRDRDHEEKELRASDRAIVRDSERARDRESETSIEGKG